MFKRLCVLGGAAVLGGSIISATPVGGAEEPFTRVRPYNLSSHLPEFFTQLLGGRVWVFRRRGALAAVYLSKNGDVLGCWLRADNSGYVRSREGMKWGIGTPNSRLNFEVSWPTSEGQRYYRMVVIYDGESGRFHGERFNVRAKKWRVARDGWIQESWPRSLKDRCSGLLLPWDLKIEEDQRSLDWAETKSRSQPVKRFPGWKRSFPGATGLGASGGKPTLTLQEVVAIKAAAHGKISIGMSGDRRVAVAWPDYTEVWAVDGNDNIVDLATSRRIRDGSIMVGRWERSARINSYHIGYPFPLIVTDRFHPGFRMMQELGAESRRVSVPWGEGLERTFAFMPGGKVVGGGEVGKWWISRGQLFVEAGGEKKSFPWRAFAKLAGWRE